MFFSKKSALSTKGRRIIISRTDGIGDVVLTLPVAGILKKVFPQCEIIFLARGAVTAVVSACEHVDRVLDWNIIAALDSKQQAAFFKKISADTIIHVFPNRACARAAKAAGIPVRIGTSHRLFHLFTCNRLVNLSRRDSALHESQLNRALLKPLVPDSPKTEMSLEEISRYYGLTKIDVLPGWAQTLLQPDRVNIVLHPRSKGSAREWGVGRFAELIALLPPDRYRVFVTGSSAEGDSLRAFLDSQKTGVIDLTGKFSLPGLIAFISKVDCLVAASTGPLHLAAALGVGAVGLFVPVKPLWPRRWMPVGKRALHLVSDRICGNCVGPLCACMQDITPEMVKNAVEKVSVR